MRISQFTDFSLRVLMLLASDDRGLVTTRVVADELKVSKNHLMKIVSDLARHGYIESKPGPNGGVRLSMAPEEINIGALVRQLERTLTIVDCDKGPCPLIKGCRLIGAFDKARDAFLKTLDDYTLEDMLVEQSLLG